MSIASIASKTIPVWPSLCLYFCTGGTHEQTDRRTTGKFIAFTTSTVAIESVFFIASKVIIVRISQQLSQNHISLRAKFSSKKGINHVVDSKDAQPRDDGADDYMMCIQHYHN